MCIRDRRDRYWLLRGGAFLARKLWGVRGALWRREPIGKITFFIHNFMDANCLDPERIRNCSFMVMTADGPVSMCAHNARRDAYVLKPVRMGPGGERVFDPATGRVTRKGEATTGPGAA